MNALKFLFLVLIIALFYSCKTITPKDDCKDSIVGEQFVLTDSLNTVVNSNLLRVESNKLFEPNRPLFVIIVWGNCHVCVHEIYKWANFIESNNLCNFQTLLIITTDNPKYFIKLYFHELPSIGALVIDSNDTIVKMNRLCKLRPDRNVFLLDEKKRVVIQGDPFVYPELKKKYLEAMKK